MNKPSPFTWSLIALGVLLAACGDRPVPAADAADRTRPPDAARIADRTADASAEAVAQEARGDVDCPPPTAPARPHGEPVADVVGVRPGMAWDEARQRVLCRAPLLVTTPDRANRFRLPPSNPAVRQGFSARFAQDRVRKSGREIAREMQAQAMARSSNKAGYEVAPGQARWYVGTMGVPGQERVTYIQREEWYPADGYPALLDVMQALIDKYGPHPAQSGRVRDGHIELQWRHDPAGRRLRDGDPLVSQCSMQARPDAGVNLSEACGVVVAAQLRLAPANPGLVQALSVGSVDQARGYARVSATVQALEQRAREQRAREVRDASQRGKGPTL